MRLGFKIIRDYGVFAHFFRKESRVLELQLSQKGNKNLKDIFENKLGLQYQVLDSKKTKNVDITYLKNELKSNSFDYLLLNCDELHKETECENLYKKLVSIIDFSYENKVEFMVFGACKDKILMGVLRDYEKLIKKDKVIKWLFLNKKSIIKMPMIFMNRIFAKNFLFCAFLVNDLKFLGSEAFTSKVLGSLQKKKCPDMAMDNNYKDEIHNN